MPTESNSSIDLELALRRFCAAHPNAADTVDGVQRWWLADRLCSRDDVERALRALVSRGEMAERRLSDGSTVYFCACAGAPPPG